MKKFLLSLMLLIVAGGMGMQVNAAWRIKGDPVTKVSDLMDYLRAHDGSGLFVVECRGADANYGIYWQAPNSYVQTDYILDSHIIRVVDAEATHEGTGGPYIQLQSNATKKWWGASSTQNGFYFEEPGNIVLLPASVYGHERSDGLIFDEENDALVFCGYPVVGDDNYNNWGFVCQPWANANYPYLGHFTGVANTNQLYLYEVEEYEDLLQDLDALIKDYEGQRGLYVAGKGPGFCDEAAITAFEAAMEKANETITDETATDEVLKTVMDELKAAFTAMVASQQEIKQDAWYYIISGLDAFFNQQGVEKAMYDDGSKPMWGDFNPNKPNQVFRFTKASDGSYAIQNLKTERYINGVGETSATVSRRQALVSLGGGFFNIKDLSGTYHANGHASGAGKGSNIVDWNGGLNSASAWKFIEITDPARLDTLRETIKQENLNDAFLAALNKARSDSAAGYITAIHNEVTSASQLITNAQEPSEGPIANLLDGNTETFFHTSWSVESDPVHYLQIALNKPLQQIALYWYKRAGNNNNRPARVTILGSNDGEQFDSIMVLQNDLPSAASKPSYFSEILNLGKAYSHIRLRVDSTNTGTKYFTMSEFALTADGFPLDEDKSMGLREDMKDVYAALKAAIDVALTVDPTKVTQEDIDAIVAANEAFSKAYPDTTVLSQAISQTMNYAANALVVAAGQEATMGMCTDQTKVDAMAAAAAAARAALDAKPKMTRAEIDAEVAKLTAANEAFFDVVVMPEANKWYYMKSLCTGREDNTYGSVVYPEEKQIGSRILWGDDETKATQNTKYMWRFVPVEGKDKVYAVQNMGTGYYLGEDRGRSTAFLLSDTVVEFKITYVAGGQLTLKQNKANSYMTHAQADGTVLVPWDAEGGSASAWTFVAADPENQVTETILLNNSGDVICLPYDITGDFYAYNYDLGIEDATIGAYTITDARYDENQNITEIGVTAMEIGEEGIPAGTPFMLIAGDINAAEGAGDSLHIDLGLIFDSEINTVAKENNGMIGLMATKTIEQTGIGYFSLTEGLKVSEGSIDITGQTGYIDGHKVVASGNADFYIPVKNGTITDIKQAIKDSKAIVNVYTVDGKLVRKNVKNADALKGLQKGLYVVNGKVYSVK